MPRNEPPSEDKIWEWLIEPMGDDYDAARPTFTHLAHYCDFSSLNGIISNNEIWFSPVALMNDFDEITAGQQMLIEHSKKGTALNATWQQLETEQPDLWTLLNQEFSDRIDSDWADSFVSCWSMRNLDANEHDNLTMWRGYASEGNGVSIVIDPSHISPIVAHMSEIVAAPVRYETPDEYIDRATKRFGPFFARLLDIPAETRWEHRNIIAAAFGEMCFSLAITHKHPGFDAEREWRFIWRNEPRRQDNSLAGYVQPRLTTDGPFERFCLPLRDDVEITPGSLQATNLIVSVMIGPCERAYFKKRAVVNLLQSHGFTNAEAMVTISDIPFRK